MKIVKVSLFLKVLVFFINFLLLFNILIIPQNIFWLISIVPLLFLFINNLLFYCVLKNNRLAIKLFWFFLILILWWFNYIVAIFNDNTILIDFMSIYEYSYFFILGYLLFLILILLNLYFLDKNIKKWVDNIDVNLVTSNYQEKPFIIIFIIIFIVLVVYRFWYYTIEKDINKVDNSFFITKYEDKNIEDDSNLYNELKLFKYNENNNNNYEDIIFSLSKKNFYKSDIYEYIIFSDFINFNDALNKKVISYMKEGDENNSIKILVAQINTAYVLLNWDSLLIDKLIAHSVLSKAFDNIDYILENYELNNNLKNELYKSLNNNIDRSIFDDSLKNEYKELIYNLDINWLPNVSTLFIADYTINWFKEIAFFRIKNKGRIWDSEFNKYNEVNYFKSNIIGQILWRNFLIPSYETQYKKIDELNDLRLKLINEINKK